MLYYSFFAISVYLYINNCVWHSVTNSPWPFIISLCSFGFFCSALVLFNSSYYYSMLCCIFYSTLVIVMWFQDVDFESNEGSHSYSVNEGLNVAIILFILSEVLFFSGWFWGFFHNSWSPNNEVGSVWPPFGLCSIDVFSVPILNTFLLLSSGVCVTWAHNSFFNIRSILFPMLITLILGFLFTLNQLLEYIESPFSLSDSFYGSSFFITTGFHGIHVILGSVFLFVVTLNTVKSVSNPLIHHIALEFSIWYWHFVDVVWLFLVSFIYIIN